MRRCIMLMNIIFLTIYAQAGAQTARDSADQKPRKLLVVGTAHLDTQWRWTIQNTINEYIPSTFRDNFKLMDIYPKYVFSFEGAFKYMLLKEYYPEEYKRLKTYIDRGQWRLAGSWVDPVDVNMPSFESLVRQTLYGNGYFKQEFGKTSKDILLPDCFGFGYTLPSLAAHCGIRSFSTQKLSWGSSVGIPFDIGLWQGVDGSKIVAALNPGSYGTQIKSDLSFDTTWSRKIDSQGVKTGLYEDFMYFGTGDIGGSPDSESVGWLDKSIKSNGPLKVSNIGSDDLSDSVAVEKNINLKTYNGELLMTRHGVGCYSSEAAMKRWNRKNELLADAAERASVMANILAGHKYPRQNIKDTWIRFLWHQFHDDLTGTSIPEAYEFSWNDEILCLNRFSGILENAVEASAPRLNTQTEGEPLLVYNPLSISRQDVVEAVVVFGKRAPKAVGVFNQLGDEVPSQIIKSFSDSLKIIFLAELPPVSYAIYDVRPSPSPYVVEEPQLSLTSTGLRNNRYIVTIDNNGDVASIFDKQERKSLLTEPIRWELLHDKPKQWPAWEIQYDDILAEAKDTLAGQADYEVLENGPVRISLKITRKTEKSTFSSIIRLASAKAGDKIEFDNAVDWYENETLLKAAFRLNSPNDSVTYDIGLGTIRRGVKSAQTL